MMLEVKPLIAMPEYFERVFQSIYSEWGDNNPNFWREWIKNSNLDGIPSTYIVLSNKEYVGTFSFWICDLQARQDLYPWVGGIVVDKKYRGRGIGLYIQEQIKILLRSLDINQAYLFTDLIGFYEKTGWKYIGTSYDDKDKIVRLYKLDVFKNEQKE